MLARLIAQAPFLSRRSFQSFVPPCTFCATPLRRSKLTPIPPSVLSITGRRQSFATVMHNVERITDHVEKPELDDRSYRVIRLSNRLEALLVHDPATDKASASLNVHVGNFSDSEEMPGMAHAVEHLLFMGTEKVCRLL